MGSVEAAGLMAMAELRSAGQPRTPFPRARCSTALKAQAVVRSLSRLHSANQLGRTSENCQRYHHFGSLAYPLAPAYTLKRLPVSEGTRTGACRHLLIGVPIGDHL
jgi:hypothetical protein